MARPTPLRFQRDQTALAADLRVNRTRCRPTRFRVGPPTRHPPNGRHGSATSIVKPALAGPHGLRRDLTTSVRSRAATRRGGCGERRGGAETRRRCRSGRAHAWRRGAVSREYRTCATGECGRGARPRRGPRPASSRCRCSTTASLRRHARQSRSSHERRGPPHADRNPVASGSALNDSASGTGGDARSRRSGVHSRCAASPASTPAHDTASRCMRAWTAWTSRTRSPRTSSGSPSTSSKFNLTSPTVRHEKSA